jgi:type IV secretion system protein VirB2
LTEGIKVFKKLYAARDAALMAAIAVASSPAFAQLEKATQSLSTVQTWLRGIAIVVATIAVMFVGFRMMFQAAQWKDVAPVFWGCVLIGGSTGIASMLVG